MLSAEIEPLTESSQRGQHLVTYTTLLFPADTGVGAAGQGAGAAAAGRARAEAQVWQVGKWTTARRSQPR